eukprot:symbB.v1.2.036501.t1/scaffold5171.1/size30161/2
MSPKKQSSSDAGYGGDQSPPSTVVETTEVVEQVDGDEQTQQPVVPPPPDMETIATVLASDDLLGDMMGSSNDDLNQLIENFQQMQLSIENQMKTVKGVLGTRIANAKAKAKAVAKAKEKQTRADAMEARRNEMMTVNFIAPNGQCYTLRISKGKTLGQLRTRILKRCQKLGLFGNVGIEGKTKTKTLLRKDIAIVDARGINLAEKPRVFLYNLERLATNPLVGIMYLTQFANGNFPHPIQMPPVVAPVVNDNAEEEEDDDEDDDEDDEED